MSDLREVIERLSSLSEAGASEAALRPLLTECLAIVGILQHTLHKSYNVIRIRRNHDDQKFTSLKHLSYRPRGGAPKGRANTTDSTLFYAASCERRGIRNGAFTDEEYGLKVALFETIPELRQNVSRSRGPYSPEYWPPFMVFGNPTLRNVEVTYAVWETKRDVTLAKTSPLVMYDRDYSDFGLARYIFESFVASNTEKHLFDDLFWNYMARQFSKLGRWWEDEIDYTASAVATELLCEKYGYDGVSYPSTRADGCGINIALTPEAADQHLRCLRVGRIQVNISGRELSIEPISVIEMSECVDEFDLYYGRNKI